MWFWEYFGQRRTIRGQFRNKACSDKAGSTCIPPGPLGPVSLCVHQQEPKLKVTLQDTAKLQRNYFSRKKPKSFSFHIPRKTQNCWMWEKVGGFFLGSGVQWHLCLSLSRFESEGNTRPAGLASLARQKLNRTSSCLKAESPETWLDK